MKNFVVVLVSFVCCAAMLFLSSCSKDEPVIVPTVATAPITNLTQTTASGGGSIASSGNGEIIDKGITWATTGSPTISLSTKSSSGSGSSSFSSNLTGLTANTTYFVRAYATNSAGTAYGNEVTFKTLEDMPPTVTTLAATNITETSASIEGNVTSIGSTPVTARGVVWGIASGPTISLATKTSNGAGVGSFVAGLTSLIANTTYFARSYATNSAGTAYGNEVTFTTLSSLPVVTTTNVTGVTSREASSGGNVTSAGPSAVTQRGLVVSILPSPTINDVRIVTGSGTGTFVSAITGLSPSTKYYIRSFATNSAGTSYGSEVSFTTLGESNLSIKTDGVDDHVTIPDNNSLDLTSVYTIEAWIKLDSYKTLAGIVSKYQTPSANGYMIRMSNLAPFNEINFDGLETTRANLSLNTWYHIAAVNNNGSRKLYINGIDVPLTGVADFVNASINTNPLKIGSDYNGRYFDGEIDEVRVWNQARTLTQIQTNRTLNLLGSESGLAAYYPFRTWGSAGGTNTGITLVRDFTANKNDGTLSGLSLSGSASNWISNSAAPPELALPTGMVHPMWYSLAAVVSYEIDSNTTGRYIRTNSIFYYYYPWNIELTSGVYKVVATSLTGSVLTFYLKQGTDTNVLSICTTSASTGFVEYGRVVGRTVTRVTHAGGSFERTTGASWVEKNANGVVTNTFTENSRNDWSVFLTKSDGAKLEIDVFLRTTFFTPVGSTTKSELYKLTGVFN